MKRWQEFGPAYGIEDYTFVDIGCGKGRAVLLASEVRFREIVGIELNTKLAVLARKMQRCGRRLVRLCRRYGSYVVMHWN